MAPPRPPSDVVTGPWWECVVELTKPQALPALLQKHECSAQRAQRLAGYHCCRNADSPPGGNDSRTKSNTGAE